MASIYYLLIYREDCCLVSLKKFKPFITTEKKAVAAKWLLVYIYICMYSMSDRRTDTQLGGYIYA